MLASGGGGATGVTVAEALGVGALATWGEALGLGSGASMGA